MAEEGFKRKLTAIFSADVAGYSRLMGEDEAATVKTLASYRELMASLIKQHRGRVVDSPGDNVLAEFVSVVDAVQCAVAVQKELQTRNTDLPENRKMEFRIGINLGDVIDEEDRIYGDGVNIAARLEALADAGGICISKTAFDQIETKLPLGYEFLGEQEVKNIAKPVGAYRVLMDAEAAGKVIGEVRPKTKQLRGAAIGGLIVLIIVAGALAIWNFYFRPAFEPASAQRMAFPLPDKPSIAVLPFVNMSDDPNQGYLADGFTENIITALSNISVMFVISRNSTFIYKGKPVKVQKVAEELGVRHVLEGSVCKAGDRIRITAQLIDAIKGHHIWAEKYDRDLKDIFAIQDEITLKICNALQMELTSGEQARMWHKGTKNLEAWGCIVKGNALFARMAKGDNVKARDLYERAVKIDPKDSFAWTMLAWTHWIDAFLGYSESRAESFKQAVGLAKKALSMDDTLSDVYALLGGISLFQRQYEKAIAAGEKSIALGPNSATSHVLFGYTMSYAGRFEEAIALIKKGIRLTPHYPAFYLYHLGRPYFQTGRYEEALAIYKQVLERSQKGEFNPLPVHLNLAATYIMLGREEEARAHVAEVLRISPNLSLEWVRKASFYRNPAHLERVLIAMRKAGLPETPPLPLPDKPSIAVLPFVNMSGDPEQEYFSDGITEELITALSKSHRLFVIARESTFYYKGKFINIPTVGRELGVKYVLEGSVRMAGDQVRITAQLIDATTSHHLWAERYDRDLKDIFAIQDEITLKILSSLQVKLTEGEQARIWAKKTKNLDVYLKVMEAISLYEKGTRESLIRFGQLGQEIVDMAPESVHGYRILAWYYWGLATFGGKPPRENIARSFKLAQKALSLDESDADSHALLGSVYLLMRQYEKAIASGERSVELIPNGAMVHGLLGLTLNFAGKPDEAINHLKQAIRLNPFPASWYFEALGRCYMQKGQYEEALTEFKKALHRAPDAGINHMFLAVIYILLDRQEEARASAKKVLEINPKFSVETVSKGMPYKNEADLKLVVEALRKAGLN